MKNRPRIYYTDSQKALMWERWPKGESLQHIANLCYSRTHIRATMQSANYTSENICRALGFGGFANDWQLAKADQCIRVLLKPSFDREVCISVLCNAGTVSLCVAAAVSQIWLQDWPVPQLTPVEQEAGMLSEWQWTRFLSLLTLAAEPTQASRVVVIDGMQAHSVLRAGGMGKLNLDQNVGGNANYGAFVAEVIAQAHSVLVGPSIRNALADVGRYVGLRIPPEVVPPAKDVVHTLVLGNKEETTQLLDALRRQHKE